MIVKTMSSVTNKKQFEYMVSWMSEHLVLARGYPRVEQSKCLYEELTINLNRLGPPIKPAKTWRRVWIHYKFAIKQKLRENILYEHFSERDRRVIDFLDLESVVRKEGHTTKLVTLKHKSAAARAKCKTIEQDIDEDDDFVWEEEGDIDNLVDGNETAHTDDSIFQFNDTDAALLQTQDDDDTNKDNESILKQPEGISNTSSSYVVNQQELQDVLQQQHQSLLKVLMSIDNRLMHLNETEEENNKLLKLILYRTSVNDKKQNSNNDDTLDNE